jgi:hypothetical protein
MTPVRTRTLAHMNQMLATATAMASCSRPSDVQTTHEAGSLTLAPDPTASVPPPPTPSASATFTGVEPPATAATATATATAVAPPNPTGVTTGLATSNTAGYLVVDMLPAPARCLGVAQASKVAGRFEAGSGGVVLRLMVTLTTKGVTFASVTPTVMGGQLVSSTFPSMTVVDVEARPTGGQLMGVNLAVSCSGRGSGTLFVHASYTGPPAVARPVTFNITDY